MSLSLHWCVPASPGRTLFVVFAYHGRDRDSQPPSWLERMDGAGARGHRIVHRDHYANPRPLAYQLAMIAAAIERLTPDQPADVVIDSALGAAAPASIAGGFHGMEIADLTNPREWRHALLTDTRAYRNVVLVYPDALGLGCQHGERRLLRDRGDVLIINGRRRVFRLDPAFGYRLDFSRWLARTRIVERALAMAIRPIAAMLAISDRVMGRA